MNNNISKIKNNFQDRNSVAWKKLCEYVDEVAKNGTDEFVPREALGDKLFSQIYTLPESIAKLKKVKKIGLYGSKLKRIPPEIGKMESLEYFDPYTSYDLKWFPYEITKCKNLKDSRISTRALFGNFKNRKLFPLLDHNPVTYFENKLKCSVCEKEITQEETNQMWITLQVGTDIIPLLANLCSKECEGNLPKPADNYFQKAHKGGANLEQPKTEDWSVTRARLIKEQKQKTHSEIEKETNTDKKEKTKLPILKLVRKIWEK
ncbi:hypothetical protein Q4Q39_05700 [Flavivirga amylovorans]|uniref:Leucine-rich repeat domain-containing protein n=1 Tax=Flavivirga amylovorans TaxID=870486 RepID=A0ABT8WYZ4_9FLAO|nr:hypothetical protein [Flavivirga amylovorans]MDO5986897.1 hypothetical protein [Flavivirga amylovorans]